MRVDDCFSSSSLLVCCCLLFSFCLTCAAPSPYNSHQFRQQSAKVVVHPADNHSDDDKKGQKFGYAWSTATATIGNGGGVFHKRREPMALWPITYIDLATLGKAKAPNRARRAPPSSSHSTLIQSQQPQSSSTTTTSHEKEEFNHNNNKDDEGDESSFKSRRRKRLGSPSWPTNTNTNSNTNTDFKRRIKLYKSTRFGRKRKRIGMLAQMGTVVAATDDSGGGKSESSEEGGGGGEKITEEKLKQISKAVDSWEAKLATFAAKFADAPDVLETNPTWMRLLMVRDKLRRMLLTAQLQALDQTRM